MTQLLAFAKQLDVTLDDLHVDVRAVWDWRRTGKTYETFPNSFEIDIDITSSSSDESIVGLIAAAKKGCFIEQTMGTANVIRHRYQTREGWREV